jgi:hypothetical protein
MKKLLFILSVFFFTLAVNGQTEDEVYIGKGKTFGNFKGIGIIIPDVDKTAKPVNGQTTVTGIVIRGIARGGVQDSLTNKRGGYSSFDLKKNDGTIVTVGTRDNGFTVPRVIVGKTITIEGLDLVGMGRRRKTINKDYQQDIQFAATGIKID